MAVDLSQLLDPKRAEHEEGWHNFAQSYERSMNTLTDALKKLSGKRQLDEGESAFTVLEKYITEQRAKTELDREKSQRLRDMLSSSIPEVTAEQKAAYEAQKKLYDQYQDELKKQTKAVEDASKAQIAAIDRETKHRIAAVDAQAAQLKREKGGDTTKSLDALLGVGEGAAKSGGKDTIASMLLAGSRDFLGKKQSERESLIEEAAELQRAAIKNEQTERVKAIEAESKARIQAIEKEVKAQAALVGVAEAPVAPEEERKKLIDTAASKMAGNEKMMTLAAASEPVVRKQQEFLRAELQQEAVEEQGGEFLAPVVTEDELPGVASPAPVVTLADKKAVAEPVGSATGGLEGGSVDGGEAKGAATKGAEAVAGESLEAIATNVGEIVPAVSGIALPLALGVKALKDIDEAFPLVTSALGALGEASKLLGPAILSASWELGGYIMELGAKVVEVIDSIAHPFSDTRKEKLEESGALEAERQRVADKKAEKDEILDKAANESIAGEYNTAEGMPQRIESIYKTPADERELTEQKETSALNDEAINKAVTAMLVAQEQAFKRQAELGQGAVPLMFANPGLESFN